MKKYLVVWLLLGVSISLKAQTVSSPDGLLSLNFFVDKGEAFYQVDYKNQVVLERSPLGLITSGGDFSRGLSLVGSEQTSIKNNYALTRIKQSAVEYHANELKLALINQDNQKFEIVFRISNNNIGFNYHLFQHSEVANSIIHKEITGFNFPSQTTTFLSPQASPGSGWKGTKPSYEEEYVADQLIGTASKYGEGYTFPGLFHIGDNAWALVSETGVTSKYCGSHLSEANKDGVYSIAFPNPKENNGIGNASPAIGFPGSTPWRTITVGDNLKPIVETTIPFDLVEPLYKPSQEYEYGRATWSWIMWQDNSMNYADQVAYIDLAHQMGYEYILIDAFWDENIGYSKMETLIAYAQSKNVDVFLWYNSNGYWNNAPQGPKHKMDTSIARKKEMEWLQKVGVKGLKVDFFGGDKQETMRLYEDILSDANDYGLMVVFHGCTLPRGWEKMFPNYVGSEAVLASENLIFTQHANDYEAYNASLHPFIRNAVGSMEFGPVLLNKRHNRTNDGGTVRKTTDVFQLATAILFQSPVQMFALAPNNLEDAPSVAIDFMKHVPTTWDETVFIDGYPGKYCVLARRHKNEWYVVGVNAKKEVLTLNIELPMFSGKSVKCLIDNNQVETEKKEIKVKGNGRVDLRIQPNGGVVLFDK